MDREAWVAWAEGVKRAGGRLGSHDNWGLMRIGIGIGIGLASWLD